MVQDHRLEKLQRLRAAGLDPYPPRFSRTHTAQEAVTLFQQAQQLDTPLEETVRLAGRLTARRDMGKVTFADLRDGSGRIQLYFKQELLGEKYTLLDNLDLGDFIGASGRLFRTRTGEATLEVADFMVLAKALRGLPEKWHGLRDVEARYRQRYLDLVASEEVRRIFTIRSQTVAAMRRFLDGQGFLEVETPVLHPSAGGALARPFITHHHALDQDLYLRIATELHLKRLIVGGFDKVYEIGRIFRNEGISIKHNPEFTSLEAYQAYADYNDMMKLVEETVAFICQEVLGTLQAPFAGQIIDFTPPWQRLTLRETIRERSGVDFEEHATQPALHSAMERAGIGADPAKSRGKLIDQLLSDFVEPTLIQPTFLLDYPVELTPLAKLKPGSPTLVERFEGFAGGLEIANAFTELNDPQEQRRRFEEQARLRAAGDEETEMLDEDFVVALEHGMPPTGGLGMGIDRLVMVLTDQQSIREVILFPQLRTKE